MKTLIQNAAILTMDQEHPYYENACIEICEGKIGYVGAQPQHQSSFFDQVVEARGKLAIPGLINAHCHSYANFVKGMAPTIPLELWMIHIMAQGEVLTPEDIYWNVLLGALEMIKTGTTCCIDHLAQGYDALDAAMQAYRDIGFRAALAPMITDKPYYATLPLIKNEVPEDLKTTAADGGKLLEMTVKLLHKWHNQENDRLKVFFGPSGPQRCTDELLAEAARLAGVYHTGFHSHVLETSAQAQTARTLYGEPMLMHLDRLGCLGENTTLVHAVWLDDEEIALAARRKAVVVHNPASNFLLGSGIAPVNKYRSHNVTVALGTDGVNVSGNHSLFGSIQLAAMIHNHTNNQPQTWIQPMDALHMATRNGAPAFLDDGLGVIRAGQKADITILSLEGSCLTTPLNNLPWQLAHTQPNELVESVFIDGRAVLLNGKLVNVDEEKILAEGERRGKRIRASIQEHKQQGIVKKIQALQQCMMN